MAKLTSIIDFCDHLLAAKTIQDYCPNGLQVEGRNQVHRLVSGVSANRQLIDQAVALKADMILTHHGYFWKGEDQCLIGIKGQRIKQLMQHNISLVAYHLPLDKHPEIGNNTLWGQAMGMTASSIDEQGLLYGCSLPEAISPTQLQQRIEQATNRQPLHLAAAKTSLKRIFWCSGGAQDYLEKAASLGADAFLSGEVSERTTHQASELNVHYFACGHHATETFGVQALAQKLAEEFCLEHQFIDIANPI